MITRAFAIWCLLASTCLANVDTAQEQLSVMQIGMPWRNVAVDPTATNDTPQQLATLGHFAAPYEVADMVTMTDRRVYDEVLNAGVVNNDGEMEAYLELRSINPEVAQYPGWNALSVGTYHATLGGTGYVHSVPCTLISDTHALAGDHNNPPVGAKVWWLTPAGDAVSTTVASVTELTNSKAKLLRLTGNPSAELARLPICTDTTLVDYDGGAIWCFFQNLSIKLRVVDGFVNDVTLNLGQIADVVEHVDGTWGTTITQGSGRPAVVALTNGRLIITGTMATGPTPAYNTRVSLDVAEIQTALDSYSETLLTSDLPDPNYSAGAIATGGFLSGYLQVLNGNLQ